MFVQEHLNSVWRAYHALRTDRQVGMDMGPIMFSSIDRYARRYSIDDLDEFERFMALIRALDHAERSFKV